MRRILASYLGIAPENIDFSYGERGKPNIAFPETDLRFNLTHSEDLALLAISRGCNVGIDVERVRERENMLGIAKRIFPAEIFNSLRVLPKEPRTEMFVQHWTSLEARAKALGQGVFSNPAANIPFVNFQPTEGWMAAVAAESAVPPANSWRVFHFDTANFVG